MKTKFSLSFLAFGFILSVFGQKATMELTFTAENNGQYVPLDSIFIENLTQGGDTTLYIPDTVLVLDYVTSIGNNEAIGRNTISVSQNYPNPFKGKTAFTLYLPEREYIKILVRDVLGRELVRYENQLIRGNHSFAFYSGNEKYYLLTVTGKQTIKTIKMLNANSNATYGGKCKIVYDKYENTVIGYKSQKAINNFVFSLGDELSYTAFTDVEQVSIINSPAFSQTITFQFETWAPCPGMSTVTDIDGNIYNTVQIGNQCWMKENLKVTTYQNGTPIPNVTDPNTWLHFFNGAYVWYDNDTSWKDLYGGLYNWYAAVDSDGLCPTGWHVPEYDELGILTDFIGGTGPPHGDELKSCRQVNSYLGWNCNTSDQPRWNQHSIHYGTDDFGFSGLPGGWRTIIGTFDYIGKYGYWWSSSGIQTYYAWSFFLVYYSGAVAVGQNIKRWGLSVRCVKD